MLRSGKTLENLAKGIETILLPKGFTVVGNENVYNDDGIQIAEFDITIEGTVGTTKFRWLIECRDRPSEGPAPGSWIEQLVGRRGRFRFNKVTAVSTTGFAKGANEYARQEGIELRNVSQITPEAISDWLASTDLRLFIDKTTLNYARINISQSTPPKLVSALERRITNIAVTENVLQSTKDGRVTSIATPCLVTAHRQNDIFTGLVPDKSSVTKTFKLNYPYPDDRFQIETDLGFIQIEQIVFEVTFSTTFKLVPMAQLIEYSTTDTTRPICQSIEWEIDLPNNKVGLVVHRLPTDSGTIIAVQTRASESYEN